MSEWLSLASLRADIVSADKVEFLVWMVIGTVIVVISGFGIFHNLRRARIIEDTPTSKIRSAAQGYVELIGMGQYFNNSPVIAPLTLSDCIWYHYQIEKKEVHHTSKGTEVHWRIVESKASPDYFKLIDDTGTCIVNPDDAEVHPKVIDTWYGHHRWPGKSSVINARKKNFFNSGDYKYTEKRIHHRDALYVLGQFRTLAADAERQSLNESISRLLNVWKGRQKDLLDKFDSNGDGDIDLKEWEAVRSSAKQQVLRERLDSALEPITHFMQKTSQRYQPFIISTRPQKVLTRRFRIFSALSLSVFIVVAPLYIWMLITRFAG